MTESVKVKTQEGVEYHAQSSGYTDYDTLCGIDADDPRIGHFGKEPSNKKITCEACRAIWRGTLALKLKEKDFDCKP